MANTKANTNKKPVAKTTKKPVAKAVTKPVVKTTKKPATKKIVATTKEVQPIKVVKVEPKVNVKKKKTLSSKFNGLIKTIKENLVLSILCLLCLLIVINIVVITIGNRTRLVDGKEVVAKLDGLSITAEDLYDDLKTAGGIDVIINQIDEYIIAHELTDTTEAETETQSYIDSLVSYYENKGYTWSDVLTDAGYANEDALFQSVLVNYKKQAVILNYLKNKVTDDEINEYYENSVYGTYTVKNIVIAPVTTDEMTEDEVTAAKATALATANEVITKLNDGKSWTSVYSEYGTDEDEGIMENFTNGDVDDSFFDAVLGLKDNNYTTTPIEDSYGYNIILKISNTEKDELNDIKSSLITKIANQKITDDTTLSDATMVELRTEYGFKIYDSIIKKAYNATLED